MRDGGAGHPAIQGTHRQTLAGVVRFNSPELHEEAGKVVEAGGHPLVRAAALRAAHPGNAGAACHAGVW